MNKHHVNQRTHNNRKQTWTFKLLAPSSDSDTQLLLDYYLQLLLANSTICSWCSASFFCFHSSTMCPLTLWTAELHVLLRFCLFTTGWRHLRWGDKLCWSTGRPLFCWPVDISNCPKNPQSKHWAKTVINRQPLWTELPHEVPLAPGTRNRSFKSVYSDHYKSIKLQYKGNLNI